MTPRDAKTLELADALASAWAFGGGDQMSASRAALIAHLEDPAWVSVPREPTPAIIAAAAIAAWPAASNADIALARRAAPTILMQSDLAPGFTVESLACAIATMAPAYRAMVAAAEKEQA